MINVKFTDIVRKLCFSNISEVSILANGWVCLAIGVILGAVIELLVCGLILNGKFKFFIPVILLALAVGRMILAFFPKFCGLDALAFSSYMFTSFLGSFITALVMKHWFRY